MPFHALDAHTCDCVAGSVSRIIGCKGSAETPALVILDNFKGQVTRRITDHLEAHNIHVCLLPPNTTDLLQPMDLSVNKPAKDF